MTQNIKFIANGRGVGILLRADFDGDVSIGPYKVSHQTSKPLSARAFSPLIFCQPDSRVGAKAELSNDSITVAQDGSHPHWIVVSAGVLGQLLLFDKLLRHQCAHLLQWVRER